MSIRVALMIIVILAVSSLIVGAGAQGSFAKPTVPEFTVKIVDHSSYVPPSYGTDPYSGESVETRAGYTSGGRAFEFTIKNQPYSKSLFYNFRFKGHYETEWVNHPFSTSHSFSEYSTCIGAPIYPASNSEYSVILVDFGKITFGGFPDYGEVDLQVQALVGEVSVYYTGLMAGNSHTFTGAASDWSSTLTLSLSSSTPDQTTKPTPSQTTESSSAESATNGDTKTFDSWLIVGTVGSIVVASYVLLVYFKKRKRMPESK